MSSDLPTLDQAAASHDSHRGRFLIEIVLRHWVLIAVCSVICAAAGATVGFVMHNVQQEYWAETDLVIKQTFWESPALRDLSVNTFGKVTPTDLVNRLDMNALALDVTDALIQDDIAFGRHGGGLTDDAELNSRSLRLLQAISIEPYDEKSLLRIQVRSAKSHEEAIRIAEFTARALVDHTQLQRADEQRQAYEIVQQQLDEVRRELDEAEGLQWDFREKMGFLTHEQVWADVETKNMQLIEAMATKDEIRAQLAEVDRELALNAQNLPGALGNVTEGVVQRLLQDIDGIRQEEIEMSVVWKSGYPDLDHLHDDLSEKKEAVLAAIGELSGGSGGTSLWKDRQSIYLRKVGLKTQLTTLDIRAASLERMLAQRIDDLPELADKSFEYEQLTHEAVHIRQQFSRLLEKEFELRTALRRGMATVERRNAAVALPISAAGAAPIGANSLVGLVIGLALSLGYSMLREMNDTSIKSAGDLRTYLGLEDIGTIPDMWSGRGRRRGRLRGLRESGTGDQDPIAACIVTQHDPKSPVAEAYRSLRTNFQFATLRRPCKSIMVTSALPGEGKTTTAVNFAVTMSDLGKRVVIVDTDLRRPSVHRALRMERGPGLADVLRGEKTLSDVILSTESENLWMISSGRVPPNPSELINSDTMTQVMKELGKTFDVVVCDAPSTLVVTDPVILATRVDAIILVISVNRTRRETVMRAKKIIETANPRIAGAVLNGLKATSRHFYYYYYYYDERAKHGRRKPEAALASTFSDTLSAVDGVHADSEK